MRLGARLLLDLGRVQKRGDDRGRADPDRHACLHKFRTPFFVRAVAFVVHARISMAFAAGLEAP